MNHPAKDILQLIGEGRVLEDAKAYYGIRVNPDKLSGPGTYKISISLDYKHIQASIGFAGVVPFDYSANLTIYKGDSSALGKKVNTTPLKEEDNIVKAQASKALEAVLDQVTHSVYSAVDGIIKNLEYSREPRSMPLTFRVKIKEPIVLWFGGELNQELLDINIPTTPEIIQLGFADLELTFNEIRVTKVDNGS